jgi:hypothetical protein
MDTEHFPNFELLLSPIQADFHAFCTPAEDTNGADRTPMDWARKMTEREML